MEFGIGEKYCSLFPILLCRTIVPSLLLEMVGRMMQRIHNHYTFFSPCILLSISILQNAYALTLFSFNIFAISSGEVRKLIAKFFILGATSVLDGSGLRHRWSPSVEGIPQAPGPCEHL